MSAALPTPTAYTVTPLFLIPCEATESLVYWLVFVWFPSVITTANYHINKGSIAIGKNDHFSADSHCQQHQ